MISVRGRPQRVCDKCGALRPGEAFRQHAGRWICNWHSHYVAPEELEKIPIRTFPVEPFKDAKPLDARDTYQTAESRILTLLNDGYNLNQYNIPDRVPPIAIQVNPQTSYGVETAGWTSVYLYELITENKRPAPMLAHARQLLKTVADWLLTRQYAGPHVADAIIAGATDGDATWGGFEQRGGIAPAPDGVFQPLHTGIAGLGLLRAYQVLGDQLYLGAARAAIWFCRSWQCAGFLTSKFTSADAAGLNRVNYRTWVRTVWIDAFSGNIPTPDHIFSVRSLGILEFYRAYRDVIGDELIGSPETAGTTTFAFSRQATVTQAINDVVEFWEKGIYDLIQQKIVTGLSTATPFEHFNAYPAVKLTWSTGTNSWEYTDGSATTGTVISAESWAWGLRGWRAAFGDTALVTGIFDWLMSFTTNPAGKLPAKYNDNFLYAPNYTNGEYDPTFALADELRVHDAGTGEPILVNGLTFRKSYNLGTVGMLASLWSARQPAAFKNFKNQLNEPRHHSVGRDEDGRYHYLALTGRCGFSLQPTQANGRFYIPTVSARIGLVYREVPQAYLGKGH